MQLFTMKSSLWILLSINVLVSLGAEDAQNVTTHEDTRKGKVNGRIVKLYTGARPEPFYCPGEGFQPDLNNCAIFYRCMRSSSGKYTVFKYQCSPGTVYDIEKETCNYPINTRRLECGGSAPVPITRSAFSDDVRQELQELPLPISTKNPIYTEKTNVVQVTQFTTVDPFANLQKIQSSTSYSWDSQKNIDHRKSTSRLKKSDPCTSDGFVGDSEDCGKFYRCVANNKGGFIKYEFTCSGSTVWDDEKQSCNHGWAVTKRSCGAGIDRNVPMNSPHFAVSTEITKRQEINYEIELSTRKLIENRYQDDLQNQKEEEPFEGSYGNRVTSASMVSTTQSQRDDSNNSDNRCTESGFMGDRNDCSKFYRCVDDGRGGFTKYEFTCGEGTVWDADKEACNHVWAVKECGGKKPSTSEKPITQDTSTTTTTTQTSQGYYDNGLEEEQNGYSETSSTTTTTTNRPNTSQSTTSVQETDHSGDFQCENSGFASDPKDCKKFYRCVDNGRGGYTKYEYQCGEGTLWDSSINGCNHDWVVKSCGENSNGGDKESTTSEPTSELTTVSLIQITTTASSENVDYDNGYGQQQSESSALTTTTTTTVKTTLANNDNECKEDGFMGDNKDCKKFYRCVGDGRGGFIRYEFACGEGTIWDPSIEGCNHQGSKQCDHENNGDQTQTYTTTKQTTSSESSSEALPVDSGYGEPETDTDNTVPDKNSDNSAQPMNPESNPNNICKTEGFMADSSNCKKFYRCVSNQRNGYDKYEFTCGEGTVWDQTIESCNYPPTGQKCATPSNVNSESISTSTAATTSLVEHDEIVSETTTMTSASTVKEENVSSTQTPQESNDVCKEEGFHADTKNCKNFYRCVDDGKAGFIKYEFTCGDKTVWDQSIQACNHESENGKCLPPKTETNTQSQPVVENENENESTPDTNSNTSESSSTQTQQASSDNCTTDGFFANTADCKKFYRCVDDGKGSYTKYDFDCGEGTVWVQELQACDHDNDVTSCTSQNQSSPESSTTSSTTTTSKPALTGSETSTSSSSTSSQAPDVENDEMPSSSSKPGDDKCTSEGFFANSQNCKKFYRCVNNGNGGYTKYDFDCGEGTAWDDNIQSCNHENEVPSCRGSNEQMNEETQASPEPESEASESPSSSAGPSSSESSTSSTQNTGSSTENSKPTSTDKCENEGYYGDSNDCKKFYRCVDNGNGGFTKYDFDCGEGTIWDQDLTTCNHPQDVANPSCSSKQEESSSSSSTTESTQSNSSQSQGSSSTTQSSSTTESESSSQSTSQKPQGNKNITCEKAGFFADPNDCKKFYRCVDWDGEGKKFSVYHFDCGEGTIWDPAVETCNHEESVYPPRDCSGSQTQGQNVTEESTTTETTTTTDTTTTQEETSTTESQTDSTTTQSSTTSTTEQSTTTQQSTTQSTTTTEQSTTQSSTTEQSTTQSSTTEQSTTQSSTTEQSTTQSSTTEQSTTQSSTTEQSTTQSSTTEQSTTQSSTTEQSTTQTSTTEESTTQSSTTEESTTTTEQPTTTTEQSTTEQSTTQSTTDSTTQSSTDSTDSTTSSTTESTTQGTTESQGSTTESSTEDSSSTTESSQETTTGSPTQECPETDDDQNVFVCPTSFRRHPKYCNLFYQCNEDDETHDVQIATFKCPNNTIYDEKQTKCVEESKADKKCDGEIAQRRRLMRMNNYRKEPIELHRDSYACASTGTFELYNNQQCYPAFLKCQKAKSSKLRGLVYQCPKNYVYWKVSRRCERKSKIPECGNGKSIPSDLNWSERWEIPVEIQNVAP